MSILKKALLNAGIKVSKAENERPAKPKKITTVAEKNQYARNFCEMCNTTQPDVERFLHKNASIDAQWICVRCADRAKIHDQFRVTAQSDFSRWKKYLREYGPTLVVKSPDKFPLKKDDDDFNR